VAALRRPCHLGGFLLVSSNGTRTVESLRAGRRPRAASRPASFGVTTGGAGDVEGDVAGVESGDGVVEVRRADGGGRVVSRVVSRSVSRSVSRRVSRRVSPVERVAALSARTPLVSACGSGEGVAHAAVAAAPSSIVHRASAPGVRCMSKPS
jgi:hypothetical protein